MAYKSRVTNKYMGATFAGQVNASNTSDATDLINILQRDVNPALQRIAEKGIAQKQDVAVQDLNKLLLTKDADTIQKEILEGKHPSLSGKYVEKTVQYHTGKYQAVDAIAEIEKNKNTYDFQTTNLPAFYKQYLPSFADKDGSYALGFASVFNEYKAKEAIKDAEVRNQFAYTKKINEGVKIVLNGEPKDAWDIINKGLDYDLPPSEGFKGVQKFYSNDEKNAIALSAANYLLDTTTTTSEIDRGLSLLSSNRGIGKDGMNLGSLMSTKRKDVSDMADKLRNKRITLENQNRVNVENKRKDDIRNIFAESNSKVQVKDEATGGLIERDLTYTEQLKLRDKLKTYGDPTALAAFDSMVDRNRYVNTDPKVFTELTSNIFEGGYASQSELMRALVDNNVPTEDFSKALSYYNNYTSDINNGVKPIYKTDFIYSTISTDIINSIKGNFNVGIAGMEKPNSGEAIRNANAYLRKEIIDFNNRYKEQNQGKLPSLEEKDAFMQKLGDVMKIRYVPENVQPVMKSFTSYEEEALAQEQQRKQKLETYNREGVTTVIEALNKQLTLDKGLIKLPALESDPRFADYIPFNQPSGEEFKQQTIVPFISNYLKTALGNIPFTTNTVKAMTQEDFNQLLRNISEQFKGSSKEFQITPIDIQKAIQMITGSK